jgi:glycosyltransferase involved in cell wall biosynthesis
MKRILYTDYSSGFGGSSTVLYDFLKHLDRKQYEPVLVVARDGQNFEKTKGLGIDVIKADIKVIGFAPYQGMNTMASFLLDVALYLIPNILTLTAIMRQKKIDLVHINNNIKHCFDVVLAARLTGRPCICHIRETRPICKIDRIFGRLIKQVIVLNQTVYSYMDGLLGSNKTRMIPDGIDLNIVVDQRNVLKLKKKFNPEHHFCIGFLGRLVEWKGVDVFIQAAALVKKHYPNVRMLIVGDDPDNNHHYQKYLRSLVAELDLDQEVVFTGWRSDKFDCISLMDVVVQASLVAEGFGLTCIEAMALGKAVIATDVAGPCSIIDEGRTGFLIEPNNPKALAETILRLIKDPALTKEMSQAAREAVVQRFDMKGKAKEIETIYQRFLVMESV